MNDYATGGLISGPVGPPDAMLIPMSREQVIFPDGSVRCAYIHEPLWWPEDGTDHPQHGPLHSPIR